MAGNTPSETTEWVALDHGKEMVNMQRPSEDIINSIRLRVVQRSIEAFIELNLLGKREFAPATGLPVQTKAAAVIGAPLTETAIRTGVFFGQVFSHGAIGVDYFSTSAIAALTACSVICLSPTRVLVFLVLVFVTTTDGVELRLKPRYTVRFACIPYRISA